MPVRHASVGDLGEPRHAREPGGHHALRGIALTLSAVLLFAVSAVSALLQHLDANLDTVDISRLVSEGPSGRPTTEPDPADPSAGRAVTFLVLGSDYRDEAAMEQEGAVTEGMRADTTIVVHVSADRSRVEAVSIPRDSLVAIPSCVMSDGSTARARDEDLVNSAFATGWDVGGDLASAAACAVRTVQHNTGLVIDHVVVVDFAGFRAMVAAVGGVRLCIPEEMHDSHLGLDLAAGEQELSGEDAFKFARSRYNNVGDGSDIDRIGNQQRLLAAMADTVLSRDVLTDPTRLVPFLSAATSSLTTDLDLPGIAGMAFTLRGVRNTGITFMTIPWVPAPSDPHRRVVWADDAERVWRNIAGDLPITAPAGTPAGSAPSPSMPSRPSAPAPPTGEPGQAPAPVQTKQAGREPFTAADVTAVCP